MIKNNSYRPRTAFILTVAMVFIILLQTTLSSADAGNWSINSNKIALTENFGSTAQSYGVRIKPFISIWISGVNKTGDDLSTVTQLRDISENNLTSCVFIGNYCKFSYPYPLLANNSYYLAGNAGGTSVVRYRNNTGAGTLYPIASDYFIWNGTYSTGTISPSDFFTFQGANVSNLDPQTRGYIIMNASTYETSTETFTLNTTINATWIPNSAILIYNGNIYSTTKNTETNQVYFTASSIDIPASIGTKNIIFQVLASDLSYTNFTDIQIVNSINLTSCGASPQNVPYINFTFKNETSSLQSLKSVTIPGATWTYWLGSGKINKTLLYSNSSENPSYSFCFSPSTKNINAKLVLDYVSAESLQRTYTLSNAMLTSIVTNKILYLLPSSIGIYTRYKVTSAANSIIEGAFGTVSRTLGGSSVLIGSGFTDASGILIFFLDPTASYDYTFSKSGVGSTSFSLVPNSVDTYTITLGSSGTAISPGSSIARNLSYQTYPLGLSLLNSTDYTFAFNVTGTSGVTLISMNITNSSGDQILYQSNAGFGYISGLANTGNSTFITGHFSIVTTNETLEFNQRWNIDNTYSGDYSLYTQLRLFQNYGFNNFVQYLMVILLTTSLVVYLSANEILDTSESKIMVIILCVWVFSVIGWLDTGIVVHSATGRINQLAQFSSQYGIAIVTSAFGGSLVLRRIWT